MYIIKMVFASLTISAIEVFLSRVRELSFEIDSSKLLVDTTIICENLVVSSLRICDEEFDKNPDVNKLELSIKMKDALLKSVNKAADEYVLLLKAEAKTPAEVQMN
jgi:hypothetical protein